MVMIECMHVEKQIRQSQVANGRENVDSFCVVIFFLFFFWHHQSTSTPSLCTHPTCSRAHMRLKQQCRMPFSSSVFIYLYVNIRPPSHLPYRSPRKPCQTICVCVCVCVHFVSVYMTAATARRVERRVAGRRSGSGEVNPAKEVLAAAALRGVGFRDRRTLMLATWV